MCIIHYKGFPNYSKLKELSETNTQRISEPKKERETLGGEHQNKDQCDSIPETFADGHCIHLESCHKKCTLILAGKTSHQHPIEQRRTSRRSAGETFTAWTYPNVCNICKKGRIQHNGNKFSPIVITSFQARETIKAAAKVKDEEI